ncbi:MAG: MBL fold metallo-hydrolase [Bacteroidota bacterium]
MFIKQIRSNDGTGTLSYIIAHEKTKNAVVIDPNVEDFQRILYLADELGVNITHIIDTHTHADHVSAAGELKKHSVVKLIMHENTKNKWKIVDQGDKFGIGDILRANAKFEVDYYVKDNDVVEIGPLRFTILFTPGHTDNHISVLIEDNLFTGDLLLIGQAGRSDLPGGNTEEQYDSLINKILPLPGSIKIWPGHDYEENTFSYLHDEKLTNPFLKQRTKKEYVEFVAGFFPPISEVAESGKMTLQCGTKRVVQNRSEPFENISAMELASMVEKNPDLYLLDVRQPFELIAFGAIPGVVNIPTSEILQRMQELPADKSQPIVSICQSGNRSYEVAHYLKQQGYTNVYNLEGGTSAWLSSSNKFNRKRSKYAI